MLRPLLSQADAVKEIGVTSRVQEWHIRIDESDLTASWRKFQEIRERRYAQLNMSEEEARKGDAYFKEFLIECHRLRIGEELHQLIDSLSASSYIFDGSLEVIKRQFHGSLMETIANALQYGKGVCKMQMLQGRNGIAIFVTDEGEGIDVKNLMQQTHKVRSAVRTARTIEDCRTKIAEIFLHPINPSYMPGSHLLEREAASNHGGGMYWNAVSPAYEFGVEKMANCFSAALLFTKEHMTKVVATADLPFLQQYYRC